MGRPSKLFVIATVIGGAWLLLFDVTVAPRLQLPKTIDEPDPQQEARFDQCFDERDARIHEQAFATIDNPDVQKEFIIEHRNEAEQDCRAKFPRRLVTAERPFAFNLIDVDFRYD